MEILKIYIDHEMYIYVDMFQYRVKQNMKNDTDEQLTMNDLELFYQRSSNYGK